MNILWISFFGSWTMPLLNAIKTNNRVGIIVPVINGKKKYETTEENGIAFFYLALSGNECYKDMTEQTFRKYNQIIQNFKPDIIHVHGTEKNLAQIQNFLYDIPVVISIQGLLTGYKPYSYNYLDLAKACKFSTLKNYFGKGGINLMYNIFSNGESYENDILHRGKYFIGRTLWDKAHVIFNNPKALYFQGEELLRKEFYENANSWNTANCTKHSIFMPSGFNPIKGLHLAVEAINLLKKLYPDVSINVPGICANADGLKRLRNPIIGEEYIRYVCHLIKKHRLEKNIKFLPKLNATDMMRQMQRAHVFLSPSSIDNSPNAIGEATMIGIPIVTTPVGGVTSFLKDGETALFAPAGDPYMIAYQIKRIFDNDNLAITLSKNAQKIALERHDIDKTTKQYLNIYRQIIQQNENTPYSL